MLEIDQRLECRVGAMEDAMGYAISQEQGINTRAPTQ